MFKIRLIFIFASVNYSLTSKAYFQKQQTQVKFRIFLTFLSSDRFLILESFKLLSLSNSSKNVKHANSSSYKFI